MIANQPSFVSIQNNKQNITLSGVRFNGTKKSRVIDQIRKFQSLFGEKVDSIMDLN